MKQTFLVACKMVYNSKQIYREAERSKSEKEKLHGLFRAGIPPSELRKRSWGAWTKSCSRCRPSSCSPRARDPGPPERDSYSNPESRINTVTHFVHCARPATTVPHDWTKKTEDFKLTAVLLGFCLFANRPPLLNPPRKPPPPRMPPPTPLPTNARILFTLHEIFLLLL